MLHLLKRHPIPITAHFRHALVLTYALPPEILEPLLPAALTLDTFHGFGFLAVALVQTEHLRPSFLPAALGHDFFLSGYRIFTRFAGHQSLRGLRIFAKRYGPQTHGSRRKFADALQLSLVRGVS